MKLPAQGLPGNKNGNPDDSAFINQIEMKWPDVHFTRIDADITDNLIDKQTDSTSVLNKEEEEKLKDLFSIEHPDLHLSIDVKGLSPEAQPVIATRPEFMRRMKDMAAISGSMGNFYANMPDEVSLTINGNHPIFQNILKEEDKEKQESSEEPCRPGIVVPGIIEG